MLVLLILLAYNMRATIGRPNTAKKNMLSPKSHKIMAEGKDVDVNKLCDAIQDNIGRQKECEAKGKYVEAEAFKRKVKELKEELQDCQMFEYKTKHQKQLRELQQAHLAQMNIFNIQWQKRIDEFNIEIEKSLQQLRIKHQKQTKQIDNQLDSEKNFHESPKLLELRKIETELGKQENYIQAHRVQQRANQMEKDEHQNHSKNRSNRKRHQLQTLKTKQQRQLQVLKMRIQSQVEERQRDRLRQQDILNHKFQNILNETQFQQNQELNNLKKRVKMGQNQKKSKVGMFSISKE